MYMGGSEYYEKSYASGKEFEKFATFLLLAVYYLPINVFKDAKSQMEIGESKQGFEFKRDLQFYKTGNIFIKTKTRSNPGEPYRNSGIYKGDNSWVYVIGDFKTIFAFGINFLKLLHKTKRYREIIGGRRNTVCGFLIPEKDAIKYCEIYLKIIQNTFKKNDDDIFKLAQVELLKPKRGVLTL